MEGVSGAGFQVVKKVEHISGCLPNSALCALLVCFCVFVRCICRILHIKILLDVCPNGYSSD